MTELFSSSVCDMCSPPNGQKIASVPENYRPGSLARKAAELAAAAKASQQPQAPQPVPPLAGLIQYGPCHKMDLTFFVYMQDAVLLAWRNRHPLGKLPFREIIVAVGRDVFNEWVCRADICSAYVPPPNGGTAMLGGYWGTVNGSPAYTDVNLSPQFLHPRDIYMFVDPNFQLSIFQAGGAINQALQNRRVVLYSQKV